MRTLALVLAVGLLAIAAPVVAHDDGGKEIRTPWECLGGSSREIHYHVGDTAVTVVVCTWSPGPVLA